MWKVIGTVLLAALLGLALYACAVWLLVRACTDVLLK